MSDTHQPTCRVCTAKEDAPAHIRRCVGEVYFCPVHCVYVRPDEIACSHIEKGEHQPCKA